MKEPPGRPGAPGQQKMGCRAEVEGDIALRQRRVQTRNVTVAKQPQTLESERPNGGIFVAPMELVRAEVTLSPPHKPLRADNFFVRLVFAAVAVFAVFVGVAIRSPAAGGSRFRPQFR